MRLQNSPSVQAVRTELRRLYVKRSAIDRLIDALTKYDRLEKAAKVLDFASNRKKGLDRARNELIVRTGT